MEYRNLGNSELTLSVITFGAWAAGGWMWGGADRNLAVRAIQAAYELGVTSVDTAPVYGQGTSESIVGEAIRNIPRDKVQLLTKFGLRWDAELGEFYFKSRDNEGNNIKIHKYSGRESIMQEAEDSLRRLGTDYIDLYQIHWPDKTTPIHETFEAVDRLISQGKVRYAGVCNYSVEEMKEAEKRVVLVSNQVPFSMVNRGIEDVLVPYCIQQNKSVIAYSPLERGLLTGKMDPTWQFKPGDHRASNPFFTSESITKTNSFLNQIMPLARQKGATLAQLVLKWTIERPGITIALAGARDPQQATENAKAANLDLSAEEINLIDEALGKLM